MKIEVEIENGNRGNLPLHLNYTTIIQISKTISKWKILNPTSSPKEVDNSAIYIHYMLSKRKSCQTHSRLSNHERKKAKKIDTSGCQAKDKSYQASSSLSKQGGKKKKKRTAKR